MEANPYRFQKPYQFRKYPLLFSLILVFGVIIILWGALLLFVRSYTIHAVEQARQEGVYSSPEEGMLALTELNYRGLRDVAIDPFYDPEVIEFSGDSSSHMRFVVAKVFAESRADGSPLHEKGYDLPGSFFLDSGDGWVWLPEGKAELVGMGMRWFNLYGCEGKDANCR